MVIACERPQRNLQKTDMREVFGDSDLDSEDPDEEGSDDEEVNEGGRKGRSMDKVLGRVGKRRRNHLRPPSSDESDSELDSGDPSEKGTAADAGGEGDIKEDNDVEQEQESYGRVTTRAAWNQSNRNPVKRKAASDTRSEKQAKRRPKVVNGGLKSKKTQASKDKSKDSDSAMDNKMRGPSRATKSKSVYSSDQSESEAEALEQSETGQEDDESNEESDSDKAVEKILAQRVKPEKDALDEGGNMAKDSFSDETAKKKRESAGSAPEYEYLVKWKSMAYIHAEWVPKSVILDQAQGKVRLQRFERKEAERLALKDNGDDEQEEEPIPEEFCIVDRVLAMRMNQSKRKKQYLIKWRALQYSESTWEYEDDVKDDEKIAHFQQRNEQPKVDQLNKGGVKKERMKFTTQPNPKLKSGGELREYQLEGYNWLISCWCRHQGSILADEMGLGKTIQSVSFCHYLFNHQKQRGPFLIVAPLSTLGHWQREFETWTWMNVIVYHGNVESREVLHRHEWTYPRQTNKKGPPYKWHALITTYETILQEASRLRSIKWNNIVVDEAHRLKNRSSRLIEELRCFNSQHRILLTGTPIQNTSLEVWSLLNFLDPEKFSDESEFAEKFGDVKDSATVQTLKETLRPYMLRRLKEDVEKSIPPKEETIVSVELTRVQKKWYRALLEQNFAFLEKSSVKSSNVGNLRNIVMELRKCCNHPFLIKGVEQIELDGIASEDDDETIRKLIEASGKLVLVDKLLPRLKEEGHKVLIFSQMIRVLDIIEDYLIARRWGYERIDGHVRGNDRQQAIDRFSKPDSEKFVFLLCTRAGGQGINLTVADTVIIYDSDWNPQNDVQAQARCHRIGQKKDVKIYRLITRGTYEMEMFDKASKKLGLDQAVLQNMGMDNKESSNASGTASGSNGILNDMKRDEVDSLLRKGAYDVFNEDDSQADAFTAEDINQILERRTTLVRTAAEPAGPSAFSKATFTVEEGPKDQNVDVNDPDFWRKIMPEGQLAPDPNIQFEPRRRRQTQRYVPLEENSSGDEVDNESTDDVISGVSPSGKPLWNKDERKRLYKGVMSFGWGRWREIASSSELDSKRSMDECALVCRNMLRIVTQNYASEGSDYDSNSGKSSVVDRFPVLRFALGAHRTIIDSAELPEDEAEDEVEAMEEDGRALETPWLLVSKGQYKEGPELVEPLFVEPALETNEFGSFLSRNAVHIFDRMDLLCTLQMLEAAGELEPDKPVAVVGSSGNQALGDWWDERFDRDLLKGTLKHGYGNYLPMRLDSSLIFLSRTEPVADEEVAEEDEEEDDDDEEDDSNDAKNGPDVKQSQSAADESEGDTLPGDVARKSESADDNQEKERSELKALGPLSTRELAAREWPSVHKLNSRVKKLIRAYSRQRKKLQKKLLAEQENERLKQQREQQRLAKLEEQRTMRERKQYLLSITWTKREKHDFARFYSFVGGAPLDENGKEDWQSVITKAKLSRKTPQTLADYALEYYRMCIQACEGTLPKMSGDPSHSKEQNGTSQADFTNVQLEEAKVTHWSSKRFLERYELLKALRALDLKSSRVKENVSKFARPPSRDLLPDWWSSGSHGCDWELLTRVARDGFDLVTIAGESEMFKELISAALQATERQPEKGESGQNVDGLESIEGSENSRSGAMVVDGNGDADNDEKKTDASGKPDYLVGHIQAAFPKDRTVINRIVHLLEVAHGRVNLGPAKEFAGSLPILPRAQVMPGVVAVRKRKQNFSRDLKRVGVLLCGSLERSFEVINDKRMSRNLLSVLKKYKRLKPGSPQKLALPDWSNGDEAFQSYYTSYQGSTSVPSDYQAPQLARPLKAKPEAPMQVSRQAKISQLGKLVYDEHGEVVFPIKLGTLHVDDLGRIEPLRKGFHSESLLFPIGYKSKRLYASIKNSNSHCDYVSEVLDGVEGPIFKVTCMDLPDEPFISKSSSSDCWIRVIRAIRSRSDENKGLNPSISGPEYFGLSHPAIQELLQELPGAEQCCKYIKKLFVRA